MDMRRDEETLIRVTELPESLRPVPIYSGETAAPIECRWLGVSFVPDGPPPIPGIFILYCLDDSGEPQEALQFKTLAIAFDEAYANAGFEGQWSICEILASEEGSFAVSDIRRALSEPGAV